MLPLCVADQRQRANDTKGGHELLQVLLLKVRGHAADEHADLRGRQRERGGGCQSNKLSSQVTEGAGKPWLVKGAVRAPLTEPPAPPSPATPEAAIGMWAMLRGSHYNKKR